MGELTGKRRYRAQKRWFKEPLLVLQVQVHSSYWTGGSIEPCLSWRDATISDQTSIPASVSWPNFPLESS